MTSHSTNFIEVRKFMIFDVNAARFMLNIGNFLYENAVQFGSIKTGFEIALNINAMVDSSILWHERVMRICELDIVYLL